MESRGTPQNQNKQKNRVELEPWGFKPDEHRANVPAEAGLRVEERSRSTTDVGRTGERHDIDYIFLNKRLEEVDTL